MVLTIKAHMNKKERMQQYLMYAHNFQESTLNLLSYKNLKQLASDYGFNGVRF